MHELLTVANDDDGEEALPVLRKKESALYPYHAIKHFSLPIVGERGLKDGKTSLHTLTPNPSP